MNMAVVEEKASHVYCLSDSNGADDGLKRPQKRC